VTPRFWAICSGGRLSAVLAIIATIISIFAVLISLQQAVVAKRATAVSALTPFFETWHSPPLKEARRRLYAGDLNLRNSADEVALREVIDRLDFLASLVCGQIVSARVVMSMFPHSPLNVWNTAKPFILSEREISPRYAENIEALVERHYASGASRTVFALPGRALRPRP
jgi:hypothetical protein